VHRIGNTISRRTRRLHSRSLTTVTDSARIPTSCTLSALKKWRLHTRRPVQVLVQIRSRDLEEGLMLARFLQRDLEGQSITPLAEPFDQHLRLRVSSRAIKVNNEESRLGQPLVLREPGRNKLCSHTNRSCTSSRCNKKRSNASRMSRTHRNKC